jgi:hypothetical protein
MIYTFNGPVPFNAARLHHLRGCDADHFFGMCALTPRHRPSNLWVVRYRWLTEWEVLGNRRAGG